MNRRTLLAYAPFAIAGVALTRCASTGGTATPIDTVGQQVVDDLDLAEETLPFLESGLTAAGLPVPAALVTALADVTDVANQVVASDTTAQAETVVQRIGGDVVAAANSVASLPDAPANVTKSAQAVVALWPVIQTAVGIITAGAAPGAMTADQARAVLRAALGK